MNGWILLLTVIALGIVGWMLVERFAPNKLAGIKTWALNIAASVPLFGPELAGLLMEYDFGRFVSEENMIFYMGGVIVLNLFARVRTSTPFIRRDNGRGGRR